jgi:hypothetical protein
VSSRPRAASPSSPPGADFSSKLRDDWRTIRRGVETAGDDFRRAIDRLKQQLTD